MARIRTIKPSFFESEDVAVLPFRARLLWIGLWTHCDDEGRTKDNVRLVKARIWPLDQVTLKDIDEDLAVLADAGRIVRYEADGQRYLEITNWRDHQSINKPTPSKIPPPPGVRQNSRRPPVAVPEDSGQERKGEEGKGGDAHAREAERTASNGSTPEPPSRCPEHLHQPADAPCGGCKEARQTNETWTRDRATAAALAQQERGRSRADAGRAAIDQCGLCDDTGYTADGLCHHDPEQPHRARSRMAEVRAEVRPATRPVRPGPVELARQRGSSLASLDAAVDGLPPLVEPATDPPEEPLARVLPIRRPAEPNPHYDPATAARLAAEAAPPAPRHQEGPK